MYVDYAIYIDPVMPRPAGVDMSMSTPTLPHPTGSLPTVQECSDRVLTAPLHGSFSIYCIVHCLRSAGTLVTTWSRENGTINASRTIITEQGKLTRNTSISIQDVQRSDEDRYDLTASSNCGERVVSTSVVVIAGGK